MNHDQNNIMIDYKLEGWEYLYTDDNGDIVMRKNSKLGDKPRPRIELLTITPDCEVIKECSHV